MSMISHVVTQLVEGYLKKATKNNIAADLQQEFTLRMQKAYNIAGYVCLGIASLSLVPPIFEKPDALYYFIVVPFILLFFGFFGALFILCCRHHRVVFNDTYIVVWSPLGKEKTTTFKKIVKTKFNATTGFLTLIDEDGQKLRVNQHLTGLHKFITRLRVKTGLYAVLPS